MPSRRERYSWTPSYNWADAYRAPSEPVPESRTTVPPPPPSSNSVIRGRVPMAVPMATSNSLTTVNPQKIVLKGERTISRQTMEETDGDALEEAIKEMIENLEGYLYVTAPVLNWEGEHGGPVIHEMTNYNNDMVFLKIEGVGYLDAESTGEDEIIEI